MTEDLLVCKTSKYLYMCTKLRIFASKIVAKY